MEKAITGLRSTKVMSQIHYEKDTSGEVVGPLRSKREVLDAHCRQIADAFDPGVKIMIGVRKIGEPFATISTFETHAEQR